MFYIKTKCFCRKSILSIYANLNYSDSIVLIPFQQNLCFPSNNCFLAEHDNNVSSNSFHLIFYPLSKLGTAVSFWYPWGWRYLWRKAKSHLGHILGNFFEVCKELPGLQVIFAAFKITKLAHCDFISINLIFSFPFSDNPLEFFTFRHVIHSEDITARSQRYIYNDLIFSILIILSHALLSWLFERNSFKSKCLKSSQRRRDISRFHNCVPPLGLCTTHKWRLKHDETIIACLSHGLKRLTREINVNPNLRQPDTDGIAISTPVVRVRLVWF